MEDLPRAGIAQSISFVFIHLLLTTFYEVGSYQFLHFTDEETGTQRDDQSRSGRDRAKGCMSTDSPASILNPNKLAVLRKCINQDYVILDDNPHSKAMK